VDCDRFQLELPDLLYGEVDDEGRHLLQEHKDDCERCRDLFAELTAVRGALPSLEPPPSVTLGIKLAARDGLLDPQRPLTGSGGVLHYVAAGILAVCVALAGFALGIGYQERRQAEAPIADDPEPLPDPRRFPEPWEIRDPPAKTGAEPIAPDHHESEGWQQALLHVARGYAERQSWERAREFFLHAVEAAPRGEGAAEARLGAAEALLQLDQGEQAAAELRQLRLDIRGGIVPGGLNVLQRIAELEAEER
jgi:hypothetical protein